MVYHGVSSPLIHQTPMIAWDFTPEFGVSRCIIILLGMYRGRVKVESYLEKVRVKRKVHGVS
jgi:hypothetical protein